MLAPGAAGSAAGKIVEADGKRVEQWGACWNRYYKLQVEYFMSSQAKAVSRDERTGFRGWRESVDKGNGICGWMVAVERWNFGRALPV